ncbi:MAG: DUF5657 family protein [Patescibacteria group bacterium]
MLEQITALLGDYLLKIGFLILDGFLVVFLFVVYKQALAMRRVINDNGTSGLINIVALANIVIAISIFVAALIIL